jgi:hypothetical protein
MTDQSRKRLPIRWLSLAEIVGLTALALTALGYWDSHRERTQEEIARAEAARERQAEQQAQAQKLTFLVTGSPNDAGDRIRMSAVHPEQVIQTQTVWFPTLVRADSVETTGNPRIEARWIEDGLRHAAGKTRQGRVPMAVETTFIEDGDTKTDRAVYWVAYSLHGRLIGGPKVQLEGLSLARRGVKGDLRAAADAAWTKP